jgi:hypothetical protein
MNSYAGAVCAVILQAFFVSVVTSPALAQQRVYADGEKPADSRLGELRHLNNYFPFHVPDSLDGWKARQDQLRTRILVANGIWPLPERTPLNVKIYGRVQRKGFTVEKVHFESYPGHFVSGLLFRPTTKGKHPAVLTPHGHGGRMQDHGDNIAALIKNGDEKHAGSGRFPKLARCAQLARMGCVTFIFDMEGYVDAVQIPMEVSHRLTNRRPDLESPERWGFFSAQAEMRLQSIMGIQTWNSIRALDFLETLDDVDAKRIGITGGSGGGTQTILLGAIDSRPIVSFPQGMVSTAMQGGCTCENCSLLRVDTGNVELAGLFAPRPLAMTGANDWTKEIQSKGYPELQKLYGLYGKQEDVFCVSFLHFAHNYNYVTRRVMYHWFNKHMELGHQEPIVEDDYELLTTKEITVWDEEHPQPESGVEHEVKLLRSIAQASQQQISKLVNTAEDPTAKVREIVGTAIRSIVMRDLPAAGEVELEKVGKTEHASYLESTHIFRHKAAGEEFPAVVFYPNTVEWNGTMILWIDGQGKAGMIGENGKPNKAIAAALGKGSAVVGIDMLYQGEFLTAGETLDEQRSAPTTNRQVPAFTFAYNHTLFAHRVHDVLSLISYMSTDSRSKKEMKLILVGTGGAGPIAATAGAIAGDAVQQAIIDTQGFRFAAITSYLDPNFFPGAIKYGDLPAILALNVPRPLVLIGEETVPRKTGYLYRLVDEEVRLADSVLAALQLK